MTWNALNEVSAGVRRVPLGDAPDPDDLAAALDAERLETMRFYDPGARLRRRLTARVTGPSVRNGALDSQVTEALVGSIGREVAGAVAGSGTPALALDLVGVGPGSAVLYFEPRDDSPGAADDELVDPPDELDSAVSVVLDLHRTAESGDLLERFAGKSELVAAFGGLTSEMDARDLEIEFDWRSRAGAHQRARLTAAGREHARAFLTKEPVSEDVVITGIVTVLDLAGSFTVRPGVGKTSPRHDIDLPEGVMPADLGLVLGQSVTVEARRTIRADAAGRKARATHVLKRVVGEPPRLPDED